MGILEKIGLWVHKIFSYWPEGGDVVPPPPMPPQKKPDLYNSDGSIMDRLDWMIK